eukprot:gene31068-37548_t
MDEVPRKKRRVIIDEDEEDDVGSDVGSNPDELLSQHSSEDEQGEDLDEHWIDDYAPAPELDYYDPAVLAKDDDPELYESYEKIVEYRLAAEEELDALDAKRRQREREADYNLERSNRFDDQEEDEYDEMEIEDQDIGADRALNLEKFDCSLKQWIAEERTRREIFRRFKKFLLTYYDGIVEVQDFRKHNENAPYPPNLRPRPPIYPDRIKSMCATNSASLLVSYTHIAQVQPLLALWLSDVPRDMIQILNEVLKSVVMTDFPNYFNIVPNVHVRITDLPIDDLLRNLRQSDVNSLVKVSGVVTRRTGVFPQLLSVAYDCNTCNTTVGPWPVVGNNEMRPEVCPNCQGHSFRSNNTKTVYGNFQKLTLQETPGTVPAGRVPRHKEVTVLDDLIDVARPGEEIEVTGIYCHAQARLSKKATGLPLFNTLIEANCIQKRSGGSTASWTEEDKRAILSLSRDPRIGERIIKSIAPSIYGHRHVKTAVALSLFGGCAKQGGMGAGSHRVRGDINVLLLGDPGTAKSQILKYSEKTAPRAIYTTGKGASAVGLTAGVHKDSTTKEWTLEGGALVLADQGVCLIDEFDKMNDQDRTSIHEAMEQQTISVSKAGIVTTLQARCSVIAAANPIGGRYDPSYSFGENVELTDPIIQRFDVLCVLQDVVDPIQDERLARFVVASHMRSHPSKLYANMPSMNIEMSDENKEEEEPVSMYGLDDSADLQPIDQGLLKKYIAYARANVKPVLHDVDSEKIALLYSELRAQSERTGGIPIAVRHIESIVRMSEASAKMHLRDHVRRDDVDLAIKVVLESFVQAQKLAVRKVLQKSFRKYLTFGEDSNLLLMHQLQGLILDVEKYKYLTKDSSNVTEVYVEALGNRAKELKVWDLQPFFRSALFRNSGFELDSQKGVIRKYYLK